ncbi:MAG: MBOAT family O-acyltransferase [Bacteroidota bacterium]
MLFNSFEFAIFLPLVFLLYWYVFKEQLRIQNLFLVGVSYLFYGWWDYRFLSLIIFSSLIDYSIGRYLSKTEEKRKRKWLLALSLVFNLGFLGFFKYYNFFVDSFIDAFAAMGVTLQASTLKIILPVGISFYTFQTLSYTIDVYRKKLEASKDPIAFFAYVSFFPQLVAGPIERATNLLPQFYKDRTFNYDLAKDGVRQILWGMFKKVVVADTCATHVNFIFENSDTMPSGVLFFGALLFAFQIYGDFSGYSDIAIGTAKLFGFNLMTNFRYPYFSRDIAEFWRRWHISLSTWFRDYLYIPLGGSRGGTSMKVRNTFIIFIVSGFWHGANWTFIVWGALNAIYFLPLLLLKQNRKNLDVVAQGKLFPNLREVWQMLITFFITVLAWIFFRAENVSHALQYLKDVLSFEGGLGSIWSFSNAIPVIILMLIVEWLNRTNEHPFQLGKIENQYIRILCYVIISYLIIAYFGRGDQQFIYFQF